MPWQHDFGVGLSRGKRRRLKAEVKVSKHNIDHWL